MLKVILPYCIRPPKYDVETVDLDRSRSSHIKRLKSRYFEMNVFFALQIKNF